jgi:hypothetical protein
MAGGFNGDEDFLNGTCGDSAESKSNAYGLLLSSSILYCVTGFWPAGAAAEAVQLLDLMSCFSFTRFLDW